MEKRRIPCNWILYKKKAKSKHTSTRRRFVWHWEAEERHVVALRLVENRMGELRRQLEVLKVSQLPLPRSRDNLSVRRLTELSSHLILGSLLWNPLTTLRIPTSTYKLFKPKCT
ncbi:hypothetical protein CR513_57459, partial [Mucuna pruriens]